MTINNEGFATTEAQQRSTDYLNEIVKSPYAWPGGYRIWAQMADGGVLCAEACKEEQEAIRDAQGDPQWTIHALFVHWEGEPLTCDHTGATHNAEYSD